MLSIFRKYMCICVHTLYWTHTHTHTTHTFSLTHAPSLSLSLSHASRQSAHVDGVTGRGQRRRARSCGLWRTLPGLVECAIWKLQHLEGRREGLRGQILLGGRHEAYRDVLGPIFDMVSRTVSLLGQRLLRAVPRSPFLTTLATTRSLPSKKIFCFKPSTEF
jgi:hypothetical protein